MAALWPPMPLTPPPRRAPAPHTNRLATSVSTPQPAGVGVRRRPTASSGRRGRCGRPACPGSTSRSSGLTASTHGRPSASRARQSGERLGQVGVEPGEVAADGLVPHGPVAVAGEQPGRRVQAEQRQRVRRRGPPAPAPGSTGRSACGSRPRPAAGRAARRRPPWRGPTPGPRSPRRCGTCRRTRPPGSWPLRSRGSRSSTMLIFICAPSGSGRRRPAPQPVEHRGRHPRQHVPRRPPASSASPRSGRRPRRPGRRPPTRDDLGAGHEVGARVAAPPAPGRR